VAAERANTAVIRDRTIVKAKFKDFGGYETKAQSLQALAALAKQFLVIVTRHLLRNKNFVRKTKASNLHCKSLQSRQRMF